MDTKLAAAVVHDIKNALGVLDGMLQELTVQPTKEQAASAQEMCSTLRDRLIGFLTLYKASSQGLTARIDAMNPEDFLNAVVRENATGRPDLEVVVNPDGMPVLGFFDENLSLPYGTTVPASAQRKKSRPPGSAWHCARPSHRRIARASARVRYRLTIIPKAAHSLPCACLSRFMLHRTHRRAQAMRVFCRY
jgi:hypothetical protein